MGLASFNRMRKLQADKLAQEVKDKEELLPEPEYVEVEVEEEIKEEKKKPAKDKK